ncbi:hypothetical protein RB2654_07736 [Rhodobacterales bacterium HTCC2654]|uniref:Uncharacterized protein n=1 Tax=Maritimibacter alkaliphilus HTCC2654 TaxID=314271 RepID=A3VIM5_9RHOB|nr:hypothetical protein RB2654_07736 [Rhodobacterales bacterium HTCC2654] [Maritimibacter alkaliphilus HTCC2654]
MNILPFGNDDMASPHMPCAFLQAVGIMTLGQKIPQQMVQM